MSKLSCIIKKKKIKRLTQDEMGCPYPVKVILDHIVHKTILSLLEDIETCEICNLHVRTSPSNI